MSESKNSSSNKENQDLNKNLLKLLENGIPVWRVDFLNAVDNADGTPETFFSLESNNKSKHVNMILTTAGLICEHKGEYFHVPPSNYKKLYF